MKEVALLEEYPAFDQPTFVGAIELIESHGTGAAFEAFSRADHSRQLGNAIDFCQWRMVARLIPYLTTCAAMGTVH